MNLRIDNPRAYELAKKLAEQSNMSLDEAVIEALESTLRRAEQQKAVAERAQAIVDDLWSKRGPNGRVMTKEEIDRMWGHD